LQPPNRKPEKEAVVFIRGFFRESVFFFFSLLLFLIFEQRFLWVQRIENMAALCGRPSTLSRWKIAEAMRKEKVAETRNRERHRGGYEWNFRADEWEGLPA
jgi:hypothetical protein